MAASVTPVRAVLGVVLAAIIGMWVYVTYLAFVPGRADPVDRLADPSFAAAAEARCAETRSDIDALPTAAESPDHLARALVVEEANRALARMLDDLEGLVPAGEDGVIVQLWLADWRTYLVDREQFAQRLREDPRAQLLVTPRAGRHITRAIDGFAQDNLMPSCQVPPDV